MGLLALVLSAANEDVTVGTELVSFFGQPEVEVLVYLYRDTDQTGRSRCGETTEFLASAFARA